jgi:hypothetical protein
MGLRPRTARRIVLIGGLVGVLLVGGVGLLTVPKWQRSRQLAGFQREGLQAHEEGRHHEAVGLLGRHIRGMRDRPVEPEVRLAIARSRSKWESSDGKHVDASVSQYRDYLRLVPGDQDAMRELLPLFNRAGMWLEARDLAVRIRPADVASAGAGDIPVLRSELEARLQIKRDDPLIPMLEERLLAERPPAFEDVWNAIARRQTANDVAGVQALAVWYNEVASETMGSRVVSAINGGIRSGERPSDPRIRDVTDAIALAIGLDIETGTWLKPPAFDNPRLVRVVAAAFDLAGRQQWSDAVFLAAKDTLGDPEFLSSAAQRAFWSSNLEALAGLPASAVGGEPVPDVLGYQALAAFRNGQDAVVDAKLAELASFDYSFRANSWRDMIAAMRALKAGRLVDARAAASSALERYRIEPMCHQVMGDVHQAMGRTGEAIESWTTAASLAEPVLWAQPYLSRVTALLRVERSLEALAISERLLAEMQRRDLFNADIFQLHLTVMSTLARNGLAPSESVETAIEVGQALRQVYGDSVPPELHLTLATLNASQLKLDAARTEIGALLSSPEGAAYLAQALQIDAQFNLGLAAQLGKPSLPDRVEDPAIATSIAQTYAAGSDEGRDERVQQALSMLNAGLAAAESNRPAWLRALAEFDDLYRPDAAPDAWRAAIAADPANIDLLTLAASSRTMGSDLAFVEAQIARITELTGSQQRTLPSPLRIARARATFGMAPTRKSREDAISMLRPVVASEPRNLEARNLLANILRFECPPGLKDDDRFTPDIAGAIDQYRAIASVIEGPKAIEYIFRITELLTRAGEIQAAARELMDVLARADRDAAIREEVARQLINLNANQQAARVFESLFNEVDGARKASVGLMLARTYSSLEDRTRAQTVLRDLQRLESLNASQVFDLAQLLAQSGLMPEAQHVLASAEQYGVQPYDAQLARARFAISFGDAQTSVTILTSLTQSQPERPEAWVPLLKLLIELGRGDDAKAVADRAALQHPENSEIQYWVAAAGSDPAAATRAMFALPEADPRAKLAFERVDAYESRRDTLSPADRDRELKQLVLEFPTVPAVVQYALDNLQEVGLDPAWLATEAAKAAALFPGDPELLSIATRAASNIGDSPETIRLAGLWRIALTGSPLEPDLFAAVARQAQGAHEVALNLLAPYYQSAIANPDQDLYRQVLLYHARSDIAVNGPEAARERLLPLAEASFGFRTTVWLDVASLSVPTLSAAQSWLEAVEPMDFGEFRHRLADAWGTLAQRFPGSAQELWAKSVEVATQAVLDNPQSPEARFQLGESLRQWGLTGPQADRSDRLSRAETAFLETHSIQPSNPIPLMSAARSADDAGRPEDAERHYRTILASNPQGLFGAATRNNLAAILWSHQPTAQRLAESVSLADQAVQFQSRFEFVGTRAWAKLRSGDLPGAKSDFDWVIELNTDSAEGWFGRAALAKSGPNPDPDAASAAFATAIEKLGSARPDPKTVKVLSEMGFGLPSDN